MSNYGKYLQYRSMNSMAGILMRCANVCVCVSEAENNILPWFFFGLKYSKIQDMIIYMTIWLINHFQSPNCPKMFQARQAGQAV